MAKTSIRVTAPPRLPETVLTLNRLGLSCTTTGPALLTISPVSASSHSHIPKNVGTSHALIPPLLVPESSTPKQTLALLRKLGTSASGPFFAAGRAGSINAALFAAACLAHRHPKIRRALDLFRSRQTNSAPCKP